MFLKRVIVLSLFLGSVILSGCSSSVSRERVEFVKSFPNPPAGSGGLYIVRDSHVWDAAKYVDIFIDGKLRTHLGNGDFSYIVLPEGSYGITSTQFGGVYRTVVYQEDLRSLGVRIKLISGKNRYIKYDYDTNSFVILDEEDGKDMVDGGNMVEEFGNNEQ